MGGYYPSKLTLKEERRMPPKKKTTGLPQVKPPVNVKAKREQKAQVAAAAPDFIELSLATYKGRLRGEGRHGDGKTDVVTPTTKEFGNSNGDRAWLIDMMEADYIEEVGEDESEVPAGALLRYVGPLKARRDYWKWPGDGRLCSGFAFIRDNDGHYIVGEGNFQLKRPCARPPILGGDVCIAHGGGVERVRKAANMRLLSASHAVIGELISIAMDTDADAKARVQAINSILDRAQIKGVTEVSLDIPAYRSVIKEAFPKWGEGEAEEAEDDDN